MSSRALKKLYGKSDLDLLSSELNREEDAEEDEEDEREIMEMQGELPIKFLFIARSPMNRLFRYFIT